MTGDSERTAAAVAKKVGVDEYYSEVLSEDKASFIEREKANGRKVILSDMELMTRQLFLQQMQELL